MVLVVQGLVDPEARLVGVGYHTRVGGQIQQLRHVDLLELLQHSSPVFGDR